MINFLRRLLGYDRIEAGVPRSPLWSGVRKDFLKTHPSCAACGSKKNLQCHHVVAYHTDKDKELDPNNIIVLCEGMESNCHRMIGHLQNFQSINENVRQDADIWLKKILHRPKWNGKIWVYEK